MLEFEILYTVRFPGQPTDPLEYWHFCKADDPVNAVNNLKRYIFGDQSQSRCWLDVILISRRETT